MVAFDQVQLAKDGGTVEVVGKVLDVGQGVPVGGGELVETPVVSPQGRQRPTSFATMWRGDNQVDFEQCTMLSFSGC